MLYNAVQFGEPRYVLSIDDERTLYVQQFDLNRLELAGDRAPIARHVGSAEGYGSLSVASNGTLVYTSPDFGKNRGDLRWRDRKGRVVGEIGSVNYSFGMSRDGKLVAFNQGGMQLANTIGGRPARVGNEPIEHEPVFSPDGRFVVYTRFGESGIELIQRTVGSEDERSLDMPPVGECYVCDWSPDGNTLLISIANSALGGTLDIWAYSVENESAEPIVASDANERSGVLSPDGGTLAYASDESGSYNIYVRPFTGSGVASRVSSEGGLYPEWRQDGKELYYMRPDGTIVAVAVTAESGFGEPTELFRVAVPPTEIYDLFDVTPDGERFLVLEQTAPPRPLILVQNWPALSEH